MTALVSTLPWWRLGQKRAFTHRVEKELKAFNAALDHLLAALPRVSADELEREIQAHLDSEDTGEWELR